MAATRVLFAKELRQHGGALLVTTALLALAWVIAHVTGQQEARSLTSLELVTRFATMPVVGVSLYLGHRLVVTEYFGRTQLFVEALPVPRGRMAAVKAVFGLVWLEVWAMGALAAAVVASRTEPIGGRFLGIMAARLACYVLALWGAAFLLGFFGRLRIPLGVLLVIGFFALDHFTAFEAQRFGPLALVASSFGLERTSLPYRACVEAVAVGVAGLSGGWAMARAKEGSIVEALARPLSSREISALVIVLLSFVAIAAGVKNDPPPEPFALTTDKRLGSEAGVEVGYFADDLAPAARRVMAELEPGVKAFARELGLEGRLPRLWVVHAPELPDGEPRPTMQDPRAGVVLRANLSAAAEAPADLVAGALHALVWARSGGRVGYEPKHWILDGVALHFARHGRRAAAPPFAAAVDRWLLRAVAAAEAVPPATSALLAYHRTSERLGDTLAMAYAASAVHVLEARIGRARLLELARAVLTRVPNGDIRDVVYDRLHPAHEVFQRATGISLEAFATSWAGELARARTAVADQLASHPRGEFDVIATPWTLAIAGTMQPAPKAAFVCSTLHMALRPYDEQFDPDTMPRASFVWNQGQERVREAIDAPVASGMRFLVVLECDAPALHAAVRLLVRRITVP